MNEPIEISSRLPLVETPLRFVWGGCSNHFPNDTEDRVSGPVGYEYADGFLYPLDNLWVYRAAIWTHSGVMMVTADGSSPCIILLQSRHYEIQWNWGV